MHQFEKLIFWQKSIEQMPLMAFLIMVINAPQMKTSIVVSRFFYLH